MSASPFQFITHRGPQFTEHDVRGFNGTLESGYLGQDQVQSLIAEHLKAIDELSVTETVAMIRLPFHAGRLAAVLTDLRIQQGSDMFVNESNGWLRVWKK